MIRWMHPKIQDKNIGWMRGQISRTIERTTNMKMNIEFIDPSNAAVEIPKTDAYLKSAQIIGEKLKALNLPNQQHNSFVKDLVEHTEITRQEAFMSGFSMALDLAKGAKK